MKTKGCTILLHRGDRGMQQQLLIAFKWHTGNFEQIKTKKLTPPWNYRFEFSWRGGGSFL